VSKVLYTIRAMSEIRLTVSNLMNYSDAARLLRVSRQTIYAMIDRGELKSIEIAERRYLLREEVERLKIKRAPVSEGAPTSKNRGEQ